MIKKSNLRQLNVKNYELNQIQSYSEEALKDTNRYIDAQTTKKCVVSCTYGKTFVINAGARNAYLDFPNKLYDPNDAYDTENASDPNKYSFTAQETKTHLIKANIVLRVSVSAAFNQFNLLIQVNKSSIDPQVSIVQNYESMLALSYLFNVPGAPLDVDVQLCGDKFINLAKGDKVKIVLYSTIDNPVIQAGHDFAQVSFIWQ